VADGIAFEKDRELGLAQGEPGDRELSSPWPADVYQRKSTGRF
jgi:hypothetical protein